MAISIIISHYSHSHSPSLLEDVPLPATPVTAFYHGCMEITINSQKLDFDNALRKHNSIKSHSCPPVSAPESHPAAPHPHWKWPKWTSYWKALTFEASHSGHLFWKERYRIEEEKGARKEKRNNWGRQL